MEQLMDLGKVSFTSGDYSLTIQNVDDDKQGLWNCQQAGRIVASYNLIVDVPPEIEMVSSSPVEVGEDSTLICQASGRPRPKIYWTRKGGETIDGAKTIELADADGVQRSQGTLVVQNVTKSMIAEISCNAQSRATTATQTTDVNVKCLPKTTNEAQTQARKSGQNGASTQSVNLLTLGFLLAYLLI
ncbi:Oidioi.mRNA.OKI2018_I69.chr2.g6594.t1.cds [Oikopleura dioica]|uniref:Oidioi.mRNA.OKI2018_I69.chr2.g6594.t1.cds n=1 Tax=Oikopleura dioica TaxID=34765 RepID=A0ABN7TCT6_OIKDI|nr:Oidioi.mRNA.OKI2018_I69.chr2.g6594.t1.cds [Oikopleura dioica]